MDMYVVMKISKFQQINSSIQQRQWPRSGFEKHPFPLAKKGKREKKKQETKNEWKMKKRM